MNEPNLYEYLRDGAAVAALCGDRIFAGLIPQHDYADLSRMPCCVFQRVGGARTQRICGQDRLVTGTYQVDSYAPKFEDAVALADAIRRRLVDYLGPMGSVSVKGVFLDADFDAGPEPEPGLYRRSQTYSVWYSED